MVRLLLAVAYPPALGMGLAVAAVLAGRMFLGGTMLGYILAQPDMMKLGWIGGVCWLILAINAFLSTGDGAKEIARLRNQVAKLETDIKWHNVYEDDLRTAYNDALQKLPRGTASMMPQFLTHEEAAIFMKAFYKAKR